jgi:hypothetical protein
MGGVVKEIPLPKKLDILFARVYIFNFLPYILAQDYKGGAYNFWLVLKLSPSFLPQD